MLKLGGDIIMVNRCRLNAIYMREWADYARHIMLAHSQQQQHLLNKHQRLLVDRIYDVDNPYLVAVIVCDLLSRECIICYKKIIDVTATLAPGIWYSMIVSCTILK